MDKATIAVLNDNERLLVAETERAALLALTEDEVIALHGRIRKARDKYVGKYRRKASVRVVEQGARGRARPKNRRAARKAEAFEEALSRASRHLAVLSRRAASELRAERLAAARATTAVPVGSRSRAGGDPPRATRSVTDEPRGDRALRSPASVKNKASTKAMGARRQAKRDSR
jgi:hypothetical protein